MSSSVFLVAMGHLPQHPMEVDAGAFQGVFGEGASLGVTSEALPVPGQALASPRGDGDVVQVWLLPSSVFSQGLSYSCFFFNCIFSCLLTDNVPLIFCSRQSACFPWIITISN